MHPRLLLLAIALLLSPPLCATAQQLPAPHPAASTTIRHTGDLGRLFPKGPTEISSSLDGSIFAMDNGSVWSVAAGGVIGSLGKPLHLFCMSAHGKWLAFVEHNTNTVRIWTLATGEIRDLPQFSEQVQHFASSPDDSTLIVVTKSGIPELFDLATGNSLRKFVRTSRKGAGDVLAFSPDGALLADGDQVWTVSTAAPFLQLEGTFRAFSADGKTLWTQAGATIDEWNIATKQKSSIYQIPATGGDQFTVRADGRFGVLSRSLEPVQLSVWDMHSGLQSGALHIPSQLGRYRVFFLGNSDWLLACSQHTFPLLVRVSTGEQLATLDSHEKNWSVVRAADGAYDASPEALIFSPQQGGGMSVDGVRVDKGTFPRVTGLLKQLPGAPGGRASQGSQRKTGLGHGQ